MTTDNPLVTVVIPNYNYAHLLPECMESVLAQTYANWELLVVDDNSSDNSREVARKFIERHPDRRIRLLHNPNGPQGTNTPINIGIRNMTGELFAWLSSDDFYLPEKLERQIQLMTSRPELGMVYTSAHTIDEDGSRVGVNHVIEKDHLKLFLDLFETPEVNGSTVIVRKHVFDTLGPLIESHPDMPCIWRVGDHLKWLEIALHYPVAVIKEPLHCTRVHPGNAPYNMQYVGRSLVPLAQTIFFDRYPPEEILEKLSPNPVIQKQFLTQAVAWFLKNQLFEKAYRYLNLLSPEEVEVVLDKQRQADLNHHRHRAALKLWEIDKPDDARALAELTDPIRDTEALHIYERASWLESHGLMEEAKKQFQLLLVFQHERPAVVAAGAHYHLGCIMAKNGNVSEARNHLIKCLKHNRDHRGAAGLLDRLGSNEEGGDRI